jgi:hypothetical protein
MLQQTKLLLDFIRCKGAKMRAKGIGQKIGS